MDEPSRIATPPRLLIGRDPLSPLRRAQLRSRLDSVLAGLVGIDARYVYFVSARTALSASEIELLSILLEAETPDDKRDGHGGDLWVTPRPGTISPWSSKATDIVHNCGLTSISRVERGLRWRFSIRGAAPSDLAKRVAPYVHDRMTQSLCADDGSGRRLFAPRPRKPLRRIPVSEAGGSALRRANQDMGLALSEAEVEYLCQWFRAEARDPSDVELMMFAQANSEHCRHKIFNGQWTVDDEPQARTLFEMIRHTHARSPGRVLSAYRDNSAVMRGTPGDWFFPDATTGRYHHARGEIDILMKVETHNHPTAISPYPGAATGSGGEIRDEAATGRGARTKAGLTGFSVSNLRLPGFEQPWERDFGRPSRIASALEIMLEGPIGAASFNNEFGRPALCGYFRTFEMEVERGGRREVRGYHKPIMIAGGMGNIRRSLIEKSPLPPGTSVVVLGGPAMLIGLGGGAASSMATGEGEEGLDFASVQRDNAEMQRRCQEVIEHCAELESDNPVLAIHDVGAGGLSNAVPELLHEAGRGGRLDLRAVPSADSSMSPLELWCNEAQERFVLAIATKDLARFGAICARERCPWSILGEVTESKRLLVTDDAGADAPIDIPMSLLLGGPPATGRRVARETPARAPVRNDGIGPGEALDRILKLPCVAAKTFLITIGDRTVGGMTCRDQMVGPWQVPVADCAVTASSYSGYAGEAMAMGERAPLALIDAPASGRMAVGEALTNLAAAPVEELRDVALSANWMAPCGHPGEDANLFDTVRAVGMELCPALGVPIPVGKDSLSMKTVWREQGEERSVTAPLSLIVSAFAPVSDIRRCLTPVPCIDRGETVLLLVDLGLGQFRLGGSALAQVHSQLGAEPPDLDSPPALADFFRTLQALNRRNRVLAYHDRSDGGLAAALCEMAFAGRCGLHIDLAPLDVDPLAALFSEELGAVLQVRRGDVTSVVDAFRQSAPLRDHVHVLGVPSRDARIVITRGEETILDRSRTELHRIWAETSYRLQALRDDPECAREEFDRLLAEDDPGLHAALSFDPGEDVCAPFVGGARPRVAILREQGVNGHVEMAAAFDRAGFDAVDVHMSDVLSRRSNLEDFHGLAAGGGFSYGDVLGGGGGWAGSIRYNEPARDAFEAFFARSDSFGLGVCNGCQMFARLGDLVPGAGLWPRFARNRSEQFEARLLLTEVMPSPSLFLAGMAGSVIPTVVAHGEGRASFARADGAERAEQAGIVCLRYVERRGEPATRYPANPNGSPYGIAGLTTPDGRFTIMMPHPERVFRTVQHSWHPGHWGEDGPWMRMFRNARSWLG